MPIDNSSSVHRPLLVDQVMDSIRGHIRSLGLQAGDRLPSESEFAGALHCSRNVLREAVGRMASLGLLEVRRGSGMFVGSADAVRSCATLLRASIAISTKDLVEFTEFRRVVEGYAVRRAASCATDAELAELKEFAAAIDQSGITREESLRYDQRFHIRLMEIGGNRLMATLLEALLEFLHASMDATTATPRDTDVSSRLHSMIIDALLQRDPDAAEQAMELNRQHTLSRLAFAENLRKKDDVSPS